MASKPVLDTDKHQVGGKGGFKRGSSKFLHTISSKVSKIETDATTGLRTYPAAAGRYHLYISPACPWCHRCWMVLQLKGLQDVISVSFVHPYLANLSNHPKRLEREGKKVEDLPENDRYRGWSFTPGVSDEEAKNYENYRKAAGAGADALKYDDPLVHAKLAQNGGKKCKHVADLYELDSGEHGGTVPILWDKETDALINNESALIIEFFNSEFDAFSSLPKGKIPNLAPEALRAQMEKVNDFVYPQINDGVYRTGFAPKQEFHEQSVKQVFEGLDRCEEILKKSKFICGNDDGLTLSDIRLWVTLIRFDRVYNVHFKCNIARICDKYPAVNEYIYRIYNMPSIKETVDMPHIKYHYYYSHQGVNGHRIVPLGPDIPYTAKASKESEQKTDQ